MHAEFVIKMLQYEDENFLDHTAFGNESTFHLNVKVNILMFVSVDQKIPMNSYN